MLFQDNSPHRRSVMRALSLFTAWGGLIFCVLNIMRGLHWLAAIEFFAAMAAVFSYYRMATTQRLLAWSVGFILCFYTIMMIALLVPNTSPTIFVWVFLLPLISYLTLGSHLGLRFTAVYVFFAAVAFYLRVEMEIGILTLSSAFNVVLCGSLIWVFSHLYEVNRERSQQALMKMASQDSLTGLNNRLRLTEIFQREVQVAKRNEIALSLLLIDVDHFKEVNDRYGHILGDRVLQGLADLIRSHSRQTDYGFRVGGEEFCLILSGANLNSASKVAETLRQSIDSESFEQDGESVYVTVSIGVAEYGNDGRDLDSLYRVADKRLYEAKTSGRNRVVKEGFNHAVDIRSVSASI